MQFPKEQLTLHVTLGAGHASLDREGLQLSATEENTKCLASSVLYRTHPINVAESGL